jgi:ADP-heptose:LPS heptosyltransferase
MRFLFWWYLDFQYKIPNNEIFKIHKSGEGIKKLLFFLPIEKHNAQLAAYFIKESEKDKEIKKNYFVHEKALKYYSKKILSDSVIYNDDDLNLFGILKTTSIINQINKKNYDALVDLNQNYNRTISLICLKLDIPIRIGFKSPLADNLYTLIVESSEKSFLEKNYKIIEKLLNIDDS